MRVQMLPNINQSAECSIFFLSKLSEGFENGLFFYLKFNEMIVN